MKKKISIFIAVIFIITMCVATLGGCNNDDDNTGAAKEPMRAIPVASAPPPGTMVASNDGGAPQMSLGFKVMNSYTEADKNYYIINAGHIQKMHIATMQIVHYNGITPMKSTTVSVTENTINQKMSETTSSSTKFAKSTGSEFNLEVSAGVSLEFSVGFIYSQQSSFQATIDVSSSFSNTQTSEEEKEKSSQTSFENIKSKAQEQSTSFTIGDNGEKAGWYRYGMYAIADLYYVISTSADNQELLSWQTSTCVRDNSLLPYLEYSSIGVFDNTPINDDIILIADEFWKLLPIPDRSIAETFGNRAAAGWEHSLWIDTSGILRASGRNTTGQLGDGTTDDRNSPVVVKAGSGGQITKFRAASAGYDHSMAIDNEGNLWTWGQNDNGQLGDGSKTISKSPVNIMSKMKFTAISAGYDHSMAIDTDGKLWAFGRNANGRLGDGTTTDRTSPVQITADDGNVTKFKSVSAGEVHTLAIDENGNVWAWGQNNDGQLGIIGGTAGNYTIPVKINTSVGGTATKAISVSAGRRHSMMIDESGSLWAFGSNDAGRLGVGDNVAHNGPVQVTADGGNITKFRTASAGENHGFAIDETGDLWAWGYNDQGQLGIAVGHTTDLYNPTRIFRNDIKFASASAGNSFGLAIDVDGDVWSWGVNGNGQLGIGSTSRRTYAWPV